MGLNVYKRQQSFKASHKRIFGEKAERIEEVFQKGFDTAINLNIPVKFAQWFESKEQSYKDWARAVGIFANRDDKVTAAYEHFISNILALPIKK